MNAGPIGIFDSGVGGVSIWMEIQQLLSAEDTVYLADSRNAPYGAKSREEVLRLSVKNTEFLLTKNCKLIVVACNTATTNAISYLRKNYNIPFIGIEPAIKPAALKTKTNKVGVLATKGTLTSRLFYNTSKLHASGIEVIEQEGAGLVDLIEQGKADSEEIYGLLQKYLTPMLEADIDCLVLGCTHYPYLLPQIKRIVPSNIHIIDSGEAVAKQIRAVLQLNQLLNSPDAESCHEFLTNGDTDLLASFIPLKEAKVRQVDF